MPTLGEQIVRTEEKLRNGEERANFNSLWDLLIEYIIPTQAVCFSGSTTKGEKKTRKIFDSTAIKANQDLANTIHSTLTNPATSWSKIRFSNDELNNDREAVAWLESVSSIMHRNFNESNFDTQISSFYLLFTAMATGLLLQEEKINEAGEFIGFNFRSIHLDEAVFSENHEGKVDRVYRTFPMTGRQAAEKFGVENLSESIRRKMDLDDEEEFKFIHCLRPRDKKDVKTNSLGRSAPDNRPIQSVYVEKETKHVVEEGGYYEFPIHTVRWEKQPGETYGRGVGLTALPDVRTLNKLKEHALHQQALALRPPIIASQRTVMGNLDMRAGSVSIVKDVDQIKEFTTSARFDVASFGSEELKQSIREIFFLDKLLLPPREEIGEMTAFEVSQRLQQMQRVIGPTIARITTELLEPLVIRSFKILLRAGALPEPPAALAGIDLDIDIKFQNQLARAQEVENVNNAQSFVQTLALAAQLKPEVVDWLDEEAYAKLTGKSLGVPESLISNDKEVDAVREQRAQQQQAAQALEAGVAMADIQSKTSGGNGAGGAQQ
jgi:hypothetical protein